MRRVRRPSDKADLIQVLVEDQNPFSTMRDALIFSAALGYAHGRREGFEKTDEPIPWEVFSNGPGAEIIEMLAAVDSDDLAILGDDDDAADRRLTVFEEYANGGLAILRERLTSDPRGEQPVVLDLVLSAEESQLDGRDLDFGAIADELSS